MRDTQWRGYLRISTGNPITLSQVRSVANLSVLGNSAQDGTPSPDNPVEVIGTGDKILPVGYTSISYIEGTGTQWIDTNFRANQDSGMYLIANVSEIIDTTLDNAGRVFAGSVNSNYNICYTTKDNLYQFQFSRKAGIGEDPNKLPFPDNLDTNIHVLKNNYLNDHKFWVDDISRDAPDWTFSNDFGIAIFRTTYSRANNYYNEPIKARIYRFKFSQGTDIIADLYPAIRDDDGKVGMYDVINDEFYTNSGTGEFIAGSNIAPAYKVPVTAQGRNLFDEEDFLLRRGVSIDDKGFIVIKNSEYLVYDIEVKPGIDYTISIITDDRRVPIVRYLDANKSVLSSKYMSPHYIPYVFGVGHKVRYVRIVGTWSSVSDVAFKNFMLIEGAYTADDMPPYEPYKEPQTFNVYIPEPLHSVGDAHDMVMIDFDNKTAKLYQKTNIKQYTSAVKNREIIGDYCLYYLDTDTDKKQMIQCKCNLFESTYATTGDINSVFLLQYDAHPTLLISIEKNIIGYDDTTDDINSGRIKLDNWLLQKQMEGTPLTVTYALADDYITTTDITALQQWDSLPNLKGTWILTANGGTEPTLRAEYYSKERSTE